MEIYKKGLRLRLGINPVVLEPGFHFLIPFGIDYVVEENIVPRVHRPAPQTLTLKDGSTIVVESVITYRVSDILKFVCGVENATSALLDTASADIRKKVSSYDWVTLLAKSNDGTIEESLTKSTRKIGEKWGIEIERVAFSSLAKARNFRLISTQTQKWEEPD